MTKLQKNLFDLSHDVKLSCDMGKLVPIMALECIPGDKHTISAEALVRFQPMLSPVMHRYDVTLHYFFVPNRIIWDNWEKFITNTPDPVTGILPAPPYLQMKYDNSNHDIGSLPDYFGVPYNLDTATYQDDENVSALPFAAYQCIYNEYYRDQNLINDVNYKLVDGDNGVNEMELLALRIRAWEHDYFTACLPWAQKGAAVDIPLGNVELNDSTQGQVRAAWKLVDYYHPTSTAQEPSDGTPDLKTTLAPGAVMRDDNAEPLVYDPNGTLQVTPTTINDLRRAFKLQEWLEKAARGGSRYIEWIKVMFGVNSSDKRLQRPEYITGSKTPIVISEVLNTSNDAFTSDAPQGSMTGHGVSVVNGGYGSYYCEEHGWIIGIMSVMPKPAYMQGVNRAWRKLTDPTEYYFSSFANIGEQEVKQSEIFAYTGNQEATFGYIPRYAEYRYMENRVAGEFRTTLDYWHQARIFGNTPNLNQEFVQCDPDKRIFAVTAQSEQSLLCHVYNKVKSLRPIPKYGTPTF